MNARFDRWLKLSQYQQRADRDRALRVGLVLALIAGYAVVQIAVNVAQGVAGVAPYGDFTLPALAGLAALALISVALVRRGRLDVAANLVTAAVFLFVAAVGWRYGLSSAIAAGVPISVLLVATIARGPVTLLYTVAVLLYSAGLILSREVGLADDLPPMAQRLVLATALATLTLLAAGVGHALRSTLYHVTRRSEEQMRSMALAARMSRHLGSALELPWLLEQAVDLLLEAYPQIDYARILVIEGGQVTAACSSDRAYHTASEADDIPPLEGEGIVARVRQARRSLLVRDTQSHPGRAGALPGVRTVAALPLVAGEELAGVLELHSARPSAFAEGDMDALATAADLIAVAMARTRLLSETRQRAEAAERQLAQAQQRLADIRNEGRRTAAQAWDQYLRGLRGNQSIQLDLKTLSTVYYDATTPTLVEAVEQEKLVSAATGAGSVVAAPIRVGAQVIGAMEFELDEPATPQQMAMITQVSERLGLAAENTRLFFEARRVADREVQVNEIGARLQAKTDLELVLTTAADGLSETLGAPRVSVRIGLPAHQPNGGDA